MSFPTRAAYQGQRYISIQEVAKKVLQKDKDFLVIDVRSSDFPGGNVPRALNIESRKFEEDDDVRDIITSTILPLYSSPTSPLELVVTHCMMSQYRGPMAASALRKHPSWPKDLPVVVMQGGYRAWRREFRERGELIEDKERDGEVGVGVGGGGEEEAFVEEQHSVEIRQKQEKERGGGEDGLI